MLLPDMMSARECLHITAMTRAIAGAIKLAILDAACQAADCAQFVGGDFRLSFGVSNNQQPVHRSWRVLLLHVVSVLHRSNTLDQLAVVVLSVDTTSSLFL